MRIVLIVALSLLSTAAHAIIGGERVVGRDWSQTVCLTYPDADGNHRAFCSGTLVAPNLVITAAHCLDGLADPLAVKVHVGNGSDAGEVEGQFEIDAAEIHPLYRLRDWEQGGGYISAEANDTYDYAYLRLTKPIPERFVEVIPVANAEETKLLTQQGATVTVVGFGRRTDDEDAYKLGLKNKLELKVEKLVGETELQFQGTSDATINNGDSGGPAFGHMPDGSYRFLGICSRGATSRGSSTYGIARDTFAWALWDSGGDVRTLAGSELNVPEEVVNDKTLKARLQLKVGNTYAANELVESVLMLNRADAEASAIHSRTRAFSSPVAARNSAKLAYDMDPFQYGRLYAVSLAMIGEIQEARRIVDDAAALSIKREDRLLRALFDALERPRRNALKSDETLTSIAKEQLVGNPSHVPGIDVRDFAIEMTSVETHGPVDLSPHNLDARFRDLQRKVELGQRLNYRDWIPTSAELNLKIAEDRRYPYARLRIEREYLVSDSSGNREYLTTQLYHHLSQRDFVNLRRQAAESGESRSMTFYVPSHVNGSLQPPPHVIVEWRGSGKGEIGPGDEVIDLQDRPPSQVFLLQDWPDDRLPAPAFYGIEILHAAADSSRLELVFDEMTARVGRYARASVMHRKLFPAFNSAFFVYYPNKTGGRGLGTSPVTFDVWLSEETRIESLLEFKRKLSVPDGAPEDVRLTTRQALHFMLAHIWATFHSKEHLRDAQFTNHSDAKLQMYWNNLVDYGNKHNLFDN